MFTFDASALARAAKQLAREVPMATGRDYGAVWNWIRDDLEGEGEQLRAYVQREADSRVGEDSGIYHTHIVRGKVYESKKLHAFVVRVYAKRPAYHANLIEYGHRVVTHGEDRRDTGRRAKAFTVFEAGRIAYENRFAPSVERAAGSALDAIIRRILGHA